MSYPHRLAQEFARAMADAVHCLDVSLHAWQLAARRAGLPDEEVRVIDADRLLFLIGQEWVVFNDDVGVWRVRGFLGEDDELYEVADSNWALDDPHDRDTGD